MHVWRSMPARTASAHAWHLFWCQGIMTRRWASSRNRELVKNSRLPPRQITSMLLGKPQFLHLRTLVTSCACAGATRDGASDVCTLEPSPRYGHAGSALLYTCAARNRVCACAQQTGEGRQKHDSL